MEGGDGGGGGGLVKVRKGWENGNDYQRSQMPKTTENREQLPGLKETLL